MGRKPAGILSRIQGNADASFRHGKITSTVTLRRYYQGRVRIGDRALQNEELKLRHSGAISSRSGRSIYDNPEK
jgi:hypothetical protein